MSASVAILIGGRARRFNGTFKPALRVGNETILQRQLDAVRAAGIEDVLVVGRPVGSLPPGLRAVADAVENAGPLAGIYSALLVATTPIVVVLAGDLPFVQPELIRTLTRLDPEEDAAVPRGMDRWHPLCASYRRRVALRIKLRLDQGALRVSDALSDMRVREVTTRELAGMDPAGMLLMNVNTPDQHTQAERHARTAAAPPTRAGDPGPTS